ncbi:MAG: hypothetical protein H6718_21430 [Polyangiaceae bacterium]|nr:hypothetical protein [Myxococcales bacterium]MCB9587982.1 hypothetical protein [Polyangiaceae bacterium]
MSALLFHACALVLALKAMWNLSVPWLLARRRSTGSGISFAPLVDALALGGVTITAVFGGASAYGLRGASAFLLGAVLVAASYAQLMLLAALSHPRRR